MDFYGDQCGPCRVLKPILESLAEAIGDKAKIVAVNVAENERLVIKYGIAACRPDAHQERPKLHRMGG